MPEFTKTMKLHIHVSEEDAALLCELTERYAEACTEISKYVFDNGFPLNLWISRKQCTTISVKHSS